MDIRAARLESRDAIATLSGAPGPGGYQPSNSVRTPKVAAVRGVWCRFVRPGVLDAGDALEGERRPRVSRIFSERAENGVRRAATDYDAYRGPPLARGCAQN